MLFIWKSPLSLVPSRFNPVLSAFGLQPLSALAMASIVLVFQSYFSIKARDSSHRPKFCELASLGRGLGKTSTVLLGLEFLVAVSRLATSMSGTFGSTCFGLNFELSQQSFRFALWRYFRRISFQRKTQLLR